MRKSIVFLLALILVFLLSACGDTGTYDEGYAAGYQAALDEMASANSDVKPSDGDTALEQTVTPTQSPTPEPTSDPVGTRKNPAEIGDPVSLSVKSNSSGTGDLTITLVEVISGVDAWILVQQANQFNDPPEDGYEYVLAKFSVAFDKDTSGTDTPLDTNRFDFDYSSTDYSISNLPSVVMPEPEFNFTLYEGATDEGWVAFIAAVDEEHPRALYIETAWFNLR